MIKLTLPFYLGKTMLGMNWYNKSHYHVKAKVKADFHKAVAMILKGEKLSSPISTYYKLYYKNARSDASNIISVIDKFLLDALQEADAIEEDNVRHYIKSEWVVVAQDKDNPRIEVEIREEGK